MYLEFVSKIPRVKIKHIMLIKFNNVGYACRSKPAHAAPVVSKLRKARRALKVFARVLIITHFLVRICSI